MRYISRMGPNGGKRRLLSMAIFQYDVKKGAPLAATWRGGGGKERGEEFLGPGVQKKNRRRISCKKDKEGKGKRTEAQAFGKRKKGGEAFRRTGKRRTGPPSCTIGPIKGKGWFRNRKKREGIKSRRPRDEKKKEGGEWNLLYRPQHQ